MSLYKTLGCTPDTKPAMSYWPSLPPELWHIIIEHAPASTKRNCLSVSKCFHDISMRSLFSSVRIVFGAWESEGLTSSGLAATARLVEAYELRRSWDILQHIIRSPSFATVVRKLVVHPYSRGAAVFEERCLIEALKALRNLQSFAWLGASPPLSSDIVEALAASCPDLERFSVPMPIPDGPSLDRLTNLKALAFPWHVSLHPDDGNWPTLEVRNAIEANARSLRSLLVCGTVIWNSPIHTLRDLTQLEILRAESLANLSLLFHHSVRLESLTLGYLRNGELAAVLEEHASALPHLTSLKLISSWDFMEAAHVETLAKFVRAKRRLRRFDLRTMTIWQDIWPVIHILPEMKRLEVLGLELGAADDFRYEDYVLLRQHLPQGLTAFTLRTFFEVMSVESALWVELFSTLSALSFLYIETCVSPIVTLHDLLADPEGLDFVGYNGSIVPIDRSGDEVIVLRPWSAPKVALRSIEDFGCEDREWLLRYHTIVDPVF